MLNQPDWVRKLTRSKSHDAIFSSVYIHFVQTAKLESPIDLNRASRKLLKSEFAETAAWPSEVEVRVTPRYKKTAQLLQRTRLMFERSMKISESKSLAAGLFFTIRYPKFGLKHLSSAWSPILIKDVTKLMQKTSIPKILLFTLKHPIVGIKHILPNTKIEFKRRNSENKDERVINQKEETEFETQDEILEEDGYDPFKPLEEAEHIILEQQIISVVERKIDADLFGGSARNNDDFVRLKLRNSYHYYIVPGSTEEQYVVFEPRLLLHKSGVMQITLRLGLESSLNTEQVLSLVLGAEPIFVRSKMSTPLISGSGWEPYASSYDDELDAGKPLAIFEYEEKISITDILIGHLETATSILGNKYTNWFNYPVTIIKPGNCCDISNWQILHKNDVHRIVVRANNIEKISDRVKFPEDFSISDDHSLYANTGSASYFEWENNEPFGLDELDTVLVFEYCLLIYMRLLALEEKVSNFKLNEKKLRSMYKEAIDLFSEMRHKDARYGTIREIADSVLNQLGANKMKNNIQSALNLSGMAFETSSAAKASKRSWLLAFIALVIAMLVSTDEINDLINLAAKEKEDAKGIGRIPLSILSDAGKLGFWAPWAIFGVILGIILMVSLLTICFRKRPKTIKGFSRGFAWPKPISVVDSPESNDGVLSTQND